MALAAGLIVAIASLVEARSQAARAEQIADFTTDMLSSIDPEVADGAETPVLDRVLADAAERVRSELSGQPRIRAEMELTIGTVHARMGDYERAREHLGTALELLADREPVDLYLAAGTELALIDVQESKLGAAEGRVDELLSLAERHRPETREAWLDLLSVRGTIRSEQARHEEALALFDRVIEAIGENPAPDVADVRIIAMRQKGQTYSEMMNLEAADEWFGRALEAASERDEPNIRAIASGLLNDRGVVLLRQQRYAEAEAVLRQAVAETERLYGERHPRAIVQYGNLAGAIRQQGGEAKLAQALPFYEKARSLALERYGPDHPQSVAFTYNLGNAYREAERIDEALAMHRQALARRNAFPDGHLFHGLVHLGLGQSEQSAGNLDTAGEHLQTAVDRLGELMGEDFFRRIEAMRSLAEVHAALGAPDLAHSLRAEARRLGGEPADD
jgi:tetratricopeptide (TPR) repeat protein